MAPLWCIVLCCCGCCCCDDGGCDRLARKSLSISSSTAILSRRSPPDGRVMIGCVEIRWRVC